MSKFFVHYKIEWIPGLHYQGPYEGMTETLYQLNDIAGFEGIYNAGIVTEQQHHESLKKVSKEEIEDLIRKLEL